MGEDYKKTYREFWKPLVEKDGELDKDRVMRELHDFHFVIENVSKVYCELTGGRISKPNTSAEDVIAVVNDVFGEAQ